jgi:3-(3-hydroxy-phenyl)propionate hydroxylase
MTTPVVTADVVIVGNGPVGATLANLLGVAGWSVAIIERFVDCYTLPRATHLDGEAMRAMQATGLAKEFAATLGVHPRMRFVNGEGRLLADWPRPTDIGPSGWRESNRFHQPALEQVLRRGLDRFPGHVALAGCEFNSLREQGEQVIARYTRIADGTAGEVRARFLVGCDGANSRVRELMDTSLEILAEPAQWLVSDILLDEPVATLSAGTVQYCDPARPITSIECVGGRHRWEIKLMPGDDAATFANSDNVWRMLAPWISPQQGRIERGVMYTFRSAVARHWRRGHTLLAGDAAHQTPPFLGQGLCAGMRDAANLAWKLDWVLKGLAPQSLLDSYAHEQSPHARAFIMEAIRIGNIIQVTDPEAAARRDQEFVSRPQMMHSIRPSIGAGLHAGWPAPSGTYSQQPVLSDGRRMDDAAGQRFVVLGSQDVIAGVSQATRDDWRRADTVILPGEGAAFLAQLGCKWVIVRPDRYILAAADCAADLDKATALIPLVRE